MFTHKSLSCVDLALDFKAIEIENWFSQIAVKMAYRLMSNHRAFFSPHYVSGSASVLTTATIRKYMFDVTSQEDFKERVLQSEKPVIVDFHATWCQPCVALAPTLKSVMENVDGEADLAKIDVDELADIAMEYDVTSVPTVAAFKDGKLIDSFVGLLDQKKIEEFVNKVVPSK
eukprot:gene10753-11903_t